MTGGSAETETGPARAVLVTGAGRGIGAAIAAVFAGQGDVTFMIDIDGPGLERQADALREEGGSVHTMTASVADPAAIAAVARWLEVEADGLDVLVNNAAVTYRGAFFDMAEAEWDRLLDVDLKGVFLMGRQCWPLLRKPGASIVNISSIHGTRLLPGLAAYGAAKGGVNALTKAMALDAAPYGVRVNAVAPGFIETTPEWPPPGEARTDRYRQIAERIPGDACGDPADVARAVLWLASAESGYVNGAVIDVDGALAAQAYPPLT